MESNIFTGTARIRARDIREQLKGKIDPTLLQTLEGLAEQDGTLRVQIEMLADLVNKFSDQVVKLSEVMGVVTDKVNAMQQIKDAALNRIKLHGEDEAENR